MSFLFASGGTPLKCFVDEVLLAVSVFLISKDHSNKDS